MDVRREGAGDLQVAPATLKRWLGALERMYLLFTVAPLTKGVPRAIQKPPRVYFFDTGDVLGDEGARFENFVATHLLKYCHFLEDRDGYKYELRYLRDKEGREVDLVITKDGVVTELYECKWSESQFDPALRYYAERLNPKRAVQVVATERSTFRQGSLGSSRDGVFGGGGHHAIPSGVGVNAIAGLQPLLVPSALPYLQWPDFPIRNSDLPPNAPTGTRRFPRALSQPLCAEA